MAIANTPSLNASMRAVSVAAMGGVRVDSHQQIDERALRRPRGWRVSHRRRIVVEESDQHLADDAAADRAKAMATGPHVGFAEDVIPERRLAWPSGVLRSNFGCRQRCLAEQPGDRFA